MATTGDPKIGVPKIDAVKGTAQAEVDAAPAKTRITATIPKLLMALVHIRLSGSLLPGTAGMKASIGLTRMIGYLVISRSS